MHIGEASCLQAGEQNGIGRSSTVLRDGRRVIVFDHGVDVECIKPGMESIPAGNFLEGVHVDLLVITHAHLDHIGAVPRFIARHPETQVVVSSKALEGGAILLRDMLKISRRNFREAARTNTEAPAEVFNRWELEKFLSGDRLEVIDGPTWINPTEAGWRGWENGWELGFHPSGHDLGAMMAFIISPCGRRIFVTGDVSAHDQPIVKGVMLPSREFLGDFFDVPGVVMITEATNGSRDAERSRAEEEDRFIRALRKVEARGGQVLCPVFAKNRASNVVLTMDKAGIVPYVDGLARDLLPIEIENFNELVAEGRILLFPRATNEEERIAADGLRSRVAAGYEGFHPIVASSATMNWGFAVQHAVAILPSRENALFLTGHVFDRSAVQRLLKTKRGETIHLMNRYGNREVEVAVNVRAEVERFDLTSHDYRSALAERVRLADPEVCIIHHAGEYEGVSGFDGLREKILEVMPHPPAIYFGEHGREIVLPERSVA